MAKQRGSLVQYLAHLLIRNPADSPMSSCLSCWAMNAA